MPNELFAPAIAAVEERCEGLAAADVRPARDASSKAVPNKVLFTREQIAAKTVRRLGVESLARRRPWRRRGRR